MKRRWIAALILFLFCLAPVRPAAAEEAIADVYHRLAPTVVNVTFKFRTDRSIENGTATGVFVSAAGLVMVSAANFPGSVSQDQFFDFSVQGDEDGAVTWPGKYLGQAQGTGCHFVQAQVKASETVPFVDFAASAALREGDEALSLGILATQTGFRRFVKVARVAAISDREKDPFYLAYDTSMDIGAPVFTLDGRPVGVVSDGNDLGRVAMPGKFLTGIQNPPDPSKLPAMPWLGVTDMQPLTKDLAEFWKLPQKDGIIVGNVIPGQPADASGLKQGDIVLALNCEPIMPGMNPTLQAFQSMLRLYKPGDTVTFGIWRNGMASDVAVLLGERPTSDVDAKRWKITDGGFNLTVRELVFTDRWNQYLKEDFQGVRVAFMETGWAFDGGLRMNDIIVEVNGEAVRDLARFQDLLGRAIADKKKEIVFQVIRGAMNTSFVARVECDWK